MWKARHPACAHENRTKVRGLRRHRNSYSELSENECRPQRPECRRLCVSERPWMARPRLASLAQSWSRLDLRRHELCGATAESRLYDVRRQSSQLQHDASTLRNAFPQSPSRTPWTSPLTSVSRPWTLQPAWPIHVGRAFGMPFTGRGGKNAEQRRLPSRSRGGCHTH